MRTIITLHLVCIVLAVIICFASVALLAGY